MRLSHPSPGSHRLPAFLAAALLVACLAAAAQAAPILVHTAGTAVFTPIEILDLYQSSLAYTTLALTAFPITSSGIRHFRFRVIGRDPGSTGYLSFFDHIQFNKR